MASEIVTENQCKKILAKYIEKKEVGENSDESEETDTPILTSFSTRPVENTLDGLIGEQFFLTLEYRVGEKHKNAKFFVKILSKANPVMYRLAKEITAFEKESFYYENFVPYLREEGFACDYVADSYLCESDAVVLEDLVQSSYKSYGKNIDLDINHCKLCLKTIAKFHTESILFELKKSSELAWEYKLVEAFSEIFEDNTFIDSNTLVPKYYEWSIRGLCQLIPYIPKNEIKDDDFCKAFISALRTTPSILSTAKKTFRTALCHNDLWGNNLLYKYDENNELLSCKIIDFQNISLKLPATDVLGFIYLNTRKSFRDQNFEDLLRYYYGCFSACLKKGDYNPSQVLTEEEFSTSCDYVKLNTKLHCVIDRSFTLMPDKVYIKHSKSEEEFSNFIFEGRGDIMTELFKTDKEYRDIMTEELCELRSLLFKQ